MLDRLRLLETLLAPVETDDEDAALAERLLEHKTPAEIAAALVHAHRAALPAPEDLISASNTPGERAPRADQGPRPGFEDTVWFRMDVGRRQNADPRWMLPLICRRGHVTKGEIGAIRIGIHESFVEIPRAIADRFAESLKRTERPDAEDESGIAIAPAPDGPQTGNDRGPRRDAPRNDGPRHDAPRHDSARVDGPRGPAPRRQLGARSDGAGHDGPRPPRGPGGPRGSGAGRPGAKRTPGNFPPQAGRPFKGKPPKR